MIVMIASIHISEEIFAIDVLTSLKSSLEQKFKILFRKRVLRLLRLYGDQALKIEMSSTFPAVPVKLNNSKL